jgi:hypothetical protein
MSKIVVYECDNCGMLCKQVMPLRLEVPNPAAAMGASTCAGWTYHYCSILCMVKHGMKELMPRVGK